MASVLLVETSTHNLRISYEAILIIRAVSYLELAIPQKDHNRIYICMSYLGLTDSIHNLEREEDSCNITYIKGFKKKGKKKEETLTEKMKRFLDKRHTWILFGRVTEIICSIFSKLDSHYSDFYTV